MSSTWSARTGPGCRGLWKLEVGPHSGDGRQRGRHDAPFETPHWRIWPSCRSASISKQTGRRGRHAPIIGAPSPYFVRCGIPGTRAASRTAAGVSRRRSAPRRPSRRSRGSGELAAQRHLVRACPFDLDRLLSHIDPGPAEESEAYVRLVYEQRRSDLSSKRNGKTGR